LRIEKTEANNKLLREKTKLIYKYEQLQNEKTHLNKELLSINDVFNQFEKYKTIIEDNLKIQKELDELRAELADFEEVIEEVEKQYNIENTNLTKNTALIDQLRKDIAENKAIENSLTLYTIYRKALKQLPYLLLAKIQPLLEKKVNDLLSIITDFTLKFDMSDSKIDIYIDRSINRNSDNQMGKYSGSKYSGGAKPDRHILVNNASGFERFISSLAIRIALLDISNLPKINFMAIDEGWSCFDTTNLNNVGQILDYLKTKFDYILTISHLNEIKQYCDTMITLRKDEKGFSKIII
jgi:DNA repair exonuclease SbcCD ATPase subunit